MIGAIGTAISDNWFVTWIFQAIAQILVAPFSALVSVLLYLDLRARVEHLGAEQLRGASWRRTRPELTGTDHHRGRPEPGAPSSFPGLLSVGKRGKHVVQELADPVLPLARPLITR